VNAPVTPFALEPLPWGSVHPEGWIRDWALAASRGAASPTSAAFAVLKIDGVRVDGWRDGRPAIGGFWDEDAAYWIDGVTRLGLVLQDPVGVLVAARTSHPMYMAPDICLRILDRAQCVYSMLCLYAT